MATAFNMVDTAARRLPSRNLFEYRIRKLFDRWYILTNAGDYEFEHYREAHAYARETLERQGYVDGDK